MENLVSIDERAGRAGSSADRHVIELFHGEYDAMVRLAYVVCGDRHDAEEIVQDAFAEVHRRWDQLLNPGGYLRSTVVNGARKRRGRASRRRQIIEHHVAEVAALDVAGSEYDHTLVSLDALPERQRTALVLAYYAGLSSEEIGEALGCRASTARSLVRRGLTRLRKELER